MSKIIQILIAVTKIVDFIKSFKKKKTDEKEYDYSDYQRLKEESFKYTNKK